MSVLKQQIQLMSQFHCLQSLNDNKGLELSGPFRIPLNEERQKRINVKE